MRTTRNINIINPESIEKALLGIASKEGKVYGISSADFWIQESFVPPLPGFQFPDKFPACCVTHTRLLNNSLDYFLQFPNCCAEHKKLNKAKWFNKADYYYLPIKSVLTYLFTTHCIESNINFPDWYPRITDYIEITINSFGQPPEGYGAPIGAGLYVGNIKAFIEVAKLPKDKKKALLSYFDTHVPDKPCNDLPDINLLIEKYKEWLSIFPFDLSLFNPLKDYFTKRTPILKGPRKTNLYSRLVGFSLVSYQEMVQFLVDTTQKILTEVNALTLYQNDILDDPDKLNLEMTVAKRMLTLKKLDTELSTDSISYRDILTEWFNDEKEFLNEIMPLLKKKEEQKPFIMHLIDGVKGLQNDDERVLCIRNLRNDGPDKESLFRDHFKTFLSGRFEDGTVTIEEGKGTRHIDLKITSRLYGEKILEFKGWWNQDKEQVVEQVCGYLTDQHPEGYIFMINDNKNKPIVEPYKAKVATENMGYIPDSWFSHTVPGTQITYFESKHKLAIHTKTLYHFIFNANF